MLQDNLNQKSNLTLLTTLGAETAGNSSSTLTAVLKCSSSSISLLRRRSTRERRVSHLGVDRTRGGRRARELSSLGRSVDRLGSSVGLLELLRLLSWGRIDISDGSVVITTALDAEDDEKDPGSEFANAADHEHGDTAVEHSIVAA